MGRTSRIFRNFRRFRISRIIWRFRAFQENFPKTFHHCKLTKKIREHYIF